VSVVVCTADGTYAIVGDLFECAEDLDNEELWRSFSANPEKQRASREKVLELADFIVPGHGRVFEVKKPSRPG
jgi:glyoxylase-like metal-dependent hydrolase (beta-lactamase superfamily II)